MSVHFDQDPQQVKRIILAIVLPFVFILGISCSYQPTHRYHQNLEECIHQLANAFHKRDSAVLNQFLHPDYHLYVLFRIGTMDEYAVIDKINFDHPTPDHQPYAGIKLVEKIKYQPLPIFHCEESKWSKTGLYCDTLSRDHLLSKTAGTLKEWRGDPIEEGRIKWFQEMENRSHRIVLIDNEGGKLIFYLTRIDNRWYWTILDRVSGDCSA
jgi:hypothetical protein